jgi:ribonuclease HI
MSFEIWIDAAWARGGYGGWSYVCFGDGEPRGVAGGDRRTTAERMMLTAAIAALESLAATPAAPVKLFTAERGLLAEEMETDRDLRDRLAKVVAARSAPVAFVDRKGSTEEVRSSFVQGWAEFALDTAKTKGAFSSAIPRSNLKMLAAKP